MTDNRLDNRVKKIWGISLILMGFTGAVLSVRGMLPVNIPDIAVRIMGIIDLLAISVFTYATVRWMARCKNK